MKVLHMVAFILLMVGGLNWLLIGLWDMDVVMKVLGTGVASKIVYVLVGLSAVSELVTHSKTCRMCKPNSASSSMPM